MKKEDRKRKGRKNETEEKRRERKKTKRKKNDTEEKRRNFPFFDVEKLFVYM